MQGVTTHTPVQLFFKCTNLLDTDGFSKSDPYVSVYDVTTGKKSLVGKTEVVKNNLNPVFKTGINVNYFFEVRQVYRFEVWDKDTGSADDFLGAVEMTMGEIMSSRDCTKTANLEKRGSITVSVLQQQQGNTLGTVRLTFRGKDLKKMDTFGKTDAYLVINRLLPNGQKKLIHKTETVMKNLNPQWNATPDLDLRDLCGGDTAAACVAIDCFDWDKHSSDDAMGGFVVSVDDLMKGRGEFELRLEKKGKAKSFGFICLDRCDFVPTTSFIDHLRAGLQLNIAFSIDFTGSNGDWRQPNSLHHYDPTNPNAYIRAMLAVSNVVQEYDNDRQFPAYGFGAVTPFTQGTSHFFPLNGSAQNAFLPGMQAVIDTYARLLPQLAFSGPTNFAPTIYNVTQGARQSPNVYTILMILTDGAITDMNQTIDAIVAADDAPLSIIIIGIGNADFSSMETLDADGKALVDGRKRASRRDLVQFVPFNQFAGRDPSMLAAAVLAEVPRQVERWGRLKSGA
ncbi:C2 domain/Copine, putative [Angomonas deanei]|uniref:C2 domain/Copine, putative n=1 Tax=Angomonas deanei TaxID=59799 RepID=A0A7G2CHP6_9TRYP|nr:C2 domain/Copine, putative [Angomonas deanei]